MVKQKQGQTKISTIDFLLDFCSESITLVYIAFGKKSLWKSLEEKKRGQGFVGINYISTLDFPLDFCSKSITLVYIACGKKSLWKSLEEIKLGQGFVGINLHFLIRFPPRFLTEGYTLCAWIAFLAKPFFSSKRFGVFFSFEEASLFRGKGAIGK